MKTSISSEVLSQSGAEKITFPPKPDGQTYRHMDRHTDIRTDIWTDGRKLVFIE